MRYIGIDPSTKTGFVALHTDGQILKAKELYGVGTEDPKRMITLTDEILAHLKHNDVICIESPSLGSKGKYVGQMFGIAWGIRMMLMRHRFSYIDVTPAQLKKYCRGKGNASKDELILPLYKKWGFSNKSDNVRDAFVLAKIAENIDKFDIKKSENLVYEREVIETVLKTMKKGA